MRQLGLTLRVSSGFGLFVLAAAGLALVACKTAPETAPAGASSPTGPEQAPAPLPPSPPAASASADAAPSGAAPPTASAPRVYPEGTSSIQAAVGESFSVALPANITVPMKWRIEPAPNSKILSVGPEKYVEQPPADCTGCTGYGGTRLFAFTAAGPGKQKLHFALRPLTDAKGAAQREVTLEIEVK